MLASGTSAWDGLCWASRPTTEGEDLEGANVVIGGGIVLTDDDVVMEAVVVVDWKSGSKFLRISHSVKQKDRCDINVQTLVYT